VVKGTNPEEYMAIASPNTGMGKVYQQTMKDNPKAFEDSFGSAQERLYSDPNSLLYASFLTYHGDPILKPFMKLNDAIVSHIAIGLQKDSELKDMLDFHLIRIYQSGIENALVK